MTINYDSNTDRIAVDGLKGDVVAYKNMIKDTAEYIRRLRNNRASRNASKGLMKELVRFESEITKEYKNLI